MSTAEAVEMTDVLNRVKNWPMTLRIKLARKILESLEQPEPAAKISPPKIGGLSAAEFRAMLKTDRLAPDDDTVERWLDEHRMEKYGS